MLWEKLPLHLTAIFLFSVWSNAGLVYTCILVDHSVHVVFYLFGSQLHLHVVLDIDPRCVAVLCLSNHFYANIGVSSCVLRNDCNVLYSNYKNVCVLLAAVFLFCFFQFILFHLKYVFYISSADMGFAWTSYYSRNHNFLTSLKTMLKFSFFKKEDERKGKVKRATPFDDWARHGCYRTEPAQICHPMSNFKGPHNIFRPLFTSKLYFHV